MDLPAEVWVSLACHVHLRTSDKQEDYSSDDKRTRTDDDEFESTCWFQMEPGHNETSGESAHCSRQRRWQRCALKCSNNNASDCSCVLRYSVQRSVTMADFNVPQTKLSVLSKLPNSNGSMYTKRHSPKTHPWPLDYKLENPLCCDSKSVQFACQLVTITHWNTPQRIGFRDKWPLIGKISQFFPKALHHIDSHIVSKFYANRPLRNGISEALIISLSKKFRFFQATKGA